MTVFIKLSQSAKWPKSLFELIFIYPASGRKSPLLFTKQEPAQARKDSFAESD